MSLITCTRQQVPVFHSTKRWMSSKSTPPSTVASSSTNAVKSHRTLPPAKMRALIALYHQADKWVTPETLLQRIDDAFVPPGLADRIDMTRIASYNQVRDVVTFEEIKQVKRAMEEAPKMAQWELGAPLRTSRQHMNPGSWNTTRAKRETKVIEALYGVVADGSKLMPGLDILQEPTASNLPKKKAEASQYAAEKRPHFRRDHRS